MLSLIQTCFPWTPAKRKKMASLTPISSMTVMAHRTARKNSTYALERIVSRAKSLTTDLLLMRLDSGHDATLAGVAYNMLRWIGLPHCLSMTLLCDTKLKRCHCAQCAGDDLSRFTTDCYGASPKTQIFSILPGLSRF